MDNKRLYIIIGTVLIVVVIALVVIFAVITRKLEPTELTTEITPEQALNLPGFVQDSETGEVVLETNIPKEVLLETNKTRYKIGEEIKITVINNLDKDITILGGTGCCSQLLMIEKIIKGGVENIVNYGGGCSDMPTETVTVGQEKVISFIPKTYDDSCGEGSLSAGRYRFFIRTDYQGVNKVFTNMITIE